MQKNHFLLLTKLNPKKNTESSAGYRGRSRSDEIFLIRSLGKVKCELGPT